VKRGVSCFVISRLGRKCHSRFLHPPECPLACSQDGTGREVPCLRAGRFRRRTDGWLAGRMYGRYLASRGLIGCPGAPQPLAISLTSLTSHFTRCTISNPPVNSTSTFRNHCKMSETCIAPWKQVSLSFYIQRWEGLQHLIMLGDVSFVSEFGTGISQLRCIFAIVRGRMFLVGGGGPLTSL
jgi:hypothetical protein